MVGELVRLGARRTPDRIAVRERHGGRERTYAQLDDRTTRLAHALLAQGLTKGDRVATWMEDGLEYVELYVAAAKAGLVIVPVNTRFRAGEARHLLEDSDARLLAWTAGVEEEVEALGADVPHLRGDGFDELIAQGSDAALPVPAADDLYILGYTSGTTGRPKGAMLTHASVLAIARMNAFSYRLPNFSVAALTGSMSFVATVPAHIICHFYVGGTNVIMGRWDPESLIDAIRDERATFTYLPAPTMRDFCAIAPQRADDWATLESVLHSASRAEPERLRELCDVIGDRFVEGWGMTENSGGLMTASTAADIRANDPRVYDTVGRAAVECVIDVIAEDGNPLPHDGSSVGELIFTSPALMTGYHGRPEATAEALRDGWLHSGDLGSIDPDGYVTIADRRTDLIVSGGMNVYPSEVEDCIAGLDGVREVAVVGAPDERWGSTVIAVVVADGLDEAAVIDHCRAQLASYKKPTQVLFADELPRTASMKVRRNAVREDVLQRLA